MKKIIFCTSFLLLCWAGFSQENNTTQTDTLRSINELKIATFQLLLPRLNVEYERMWNKDSSWGGSFAFGPDRWWSYYVQGFYRYYFISSQNYGIEGVFGEVFLGAYGGGLITHYSIDIDAPRRIVRHKLAPGAGFSVGKKWIHKKGFILQIHVGYGMRLGGEVLNGGIYLGYRFGK